MDCTLGLSQVEGLRMLNGLQRVCWSRSNTKALNRKKDITHLIYVNGSEAKMGRLEVPTEQTPGFTASGPRGPRLIARC